MESSQSGEKRPSSSEGRGEDEPPKKPKFDINAINEISNATDENAESTDRASDNVESSDKPTRGMNMPSLSDCDDDPIDDPADIDQDEGIVVDNVVAHLLDAVAPEDPTGLQVQSLNPADPAAIIDSQDTADPIEIDSVVSVDPIDILVSVDLADPSADDIDDVHSVDPITTDGIADTAGDGAPVNVADSIDVDNEAPIDLTTEKSN